MKEKILLTRTLHDFALKGLKKKFQVEIHTGKIPMPQKTLKSKIKEMDMKAYDTKITMKNKLAEDALANFILKQVHV